MFDEYKPKTNKDLEQLRLEVSNPFYVYVLVQENRNMYHPREEFLSNTHNEEYFNQYLPTNLKKGAHSMEKCEEDAENQIDFSALDIPFQKNIVTVVGEDNLEFGNK